MSTKELTWKDYYKDLDIPKKWENISYGNDEYPSFDFNGYTIWINSPIRKEREQSYLGMGFENLDDYKDWIFSVSYTSEYGCGSDILISTCDFEKVKKFVEKPDVVCLKGALSELFNHEVDFDLSHNVLRAFVKDWLNGKSKYETVDEEAFGQDSNGRVVLKYEEILSSTEEKQT